MVVPVLMMSCQVSLKPNSGPEAAQRINAAIAMVNATGRPTAREAHLATRVKTEVFFVTLIVMSEGNMRESDLQSRLRVVLDATDQQPRPSPVNLRSAIKTALPKSSLRTRHERHTISSI
jgi:hypothetical protein